MSSSTPAPGPSTWWAQAVIVPAVIPCGECAPCQAGRGAICATQLFPGNDDHGGFASHVVVPARGLCPVDTTALEAAGGALSDLSVIADAVTTPYQAILNADLAAGDVAVWVGVGGVGAFGVQLSKALGAHVVAFDVHEGRVQLAGELGADLALQSTDDVRGLKKQVRGWAKEHGLPRTQWKIFESSGHPGGQTLAFSLLNHGAHLGIVGYTRTPVSVRLSNLMAFDATAPRHLGLPAGALPRRRRPGHERQDPAGPAHRAAPHGRHQRGLRGPPPRQAAQAPGGWSRTSEPMRECKHHEHRVAATHER